MSGHRAAAKPLHVYGDMRARGYHAHVHRGARNSPVTTPLPPLQPACRARTQQALAAQTRRHRVLDVAEQRMLHRALTQQLWNWGFDIRGPQGNLLIAHGAERCPPPADTRAHSSYQWTLPGGFRLILWGFGVLLQPQETPGMLLLRRDGKPLAVRDASGVRACWDVESAAACAADPQEHEAAYVRELLRILAQWIHTYEAWVETSQATGYRDSALEGWRDRNPTSALTIEESEQFWQALGRS